jgi:hypothetical protein
LALAILLGFAAPFASAASETITFLNPLGKVEPLDNQPLAERPDSLRGKTVLLLYYGAACNSEVGQALGQLLTAEYTTAIIKQDDPGIPALGLPYDARSAANYDTWAACADAVIIGVADENVGSWWVSYHVKQLEARGVPVVVVVNSPFESAVLHGAQDNGFSGIRTAVIDHKWYSQAYGRAATGAAPTARFTYIKENVLIKQNQDAALQNRGTVYQQVKAALTAPLTAKERTPDPISPLELGDIGVDTLSVTGTSYAKAVQNFNDMSMELGFGDGLPLVIPTAKLVDEMLGGTTRGRDEVLGKIRLRGGIITVEKVAINAVMAGARPEHFPVILAAMEAYANGWEDGKLFYQATSSSDQNVLMLLVSGPLSRELDISDARAVGASGNEASAVIGHAVRLCIRNIGHGQTQDTAARATGRINDHALLVIGERIEYLPSGWKTHSEMMGFPSGSSTVTLQVVSGARFNATIGEPSMAFTPASIMTSMRGTIGANVTIAQFTPANAEVMAAAASGTYVSQNGNSGGAGMGLATKEAVQLSLVNNNADNKNLVWPIVTSDDPAQSRSFNASFGTRGYQTQLITGATKTTYGRGSTPPSAPRDFTVTFSPDGTTARLDWSAPASNGGRIITRYDVSSTDGAGAGSTNAAGSAAWVSAGTATSYTFTGLTPDTRYYFRVRAVNGVNNAADIALSGSAYAVSHGAAGRGAWAGVVALSTMYTVTATQVTGASISLSAESVSPGGSVVATITADEGYKVTDVRVNGVSVGAVASYTISNITANTTITVAVTRVYTVSVTAPANGGITLSSPTVAAGGSVTVTITPDEGYKIADVLVNGVSVGAVTSYTITNVTSNPTVSAVFEKIVTGGGGAGTGTGTGTGTGGGNTKPDTNLPDDGKVPGDEQPGGAVTNPFIDVGLGDWFYNSVMYAFENGLMNGISASRFGPDTTLTRGMLVTILYRMEGSPAVSGGAVFDDVAPGMYYTQAVEWASGHGIVTGYGNGKFGPDDLITREQLAAILYRYASYKGYDVSGQADLRSYSDEAKIHDYAVTPMRWASFTGLIAGRSATTLVPAGNATRAEAATILMRFDENVA